MEQTTNTTIIQPIEPKNAVQSIESKISIEEFYKEKIKKYKNKKTGHNSDGFFGCPLL